MKFSVECGRSDLSSKLFRYQASTSFGSLPTMDRTLSSMEQMDNKSDASDGSGSGPSTINRIVAKRKSSVRFTLPPDAKPSFDCFGTGKPCDYHAEFARAQSGLGRDSGSRSGSLTPRYNELSLSFNVFNHFPEQIIFL